MFFTGNFSAGRSLLLCLALYLCPLPATASDSLLTGTIKDHSGSPVRDATLLILELKRKSGVDENGTYRFMDLPPQTYTLQIKSSDFGTKIQSITIKPGENRIDFVFDVVVHEEVTVTASPRRINISDAAQAVDVLNEDELQMKIQPTLGETLATQPGVTSSYFGPAASRPVIRGLGGDRIRILEGGVATGDVSSVSADHALAIDTSSTERVEILRGPASLRYGSNAVGGVVNVLDNRIPSALTSGPFTGSLTLRGNTVSDERTSAATVEGSQSRLAWHVDFTRTDTHDTKIPGFAELEPEDDEHEEEAGILENSAQEIRKGAVGASLIFDRGFIGLAYSDYDSFYGIPGQNHHHGEEEEEEEEEEVFVSIDVERQRFDLKSGLQLRAGPFESADFRMTHTDYQHIELEGEAVGTVFDNQYLETRLEVVQKRLGPFTSGSFGLQYAKRDFQAVGEEAFVPPNDMSQMAFFAYQELEQGNLAFTLGARYEYQTNEGLFGNDHHHEEEEEEEEEETERQLADRSFNGFSGAVGLVYGKQRPYSVAVHLTRTERAPTPEELLSNGPHLATSAFEIGNPDFDVEESLGSDLVLRKKEGRITGELNLFYNRFDGYIFERATGEVEDGLAVFRYDQGDADYKGGELHLDVDLYHTEPHHLSLEMAYDIVRAELDGGGDIPRIPPDRFTLGLAYRRPGLWADLEMRHNDKQERIASYETTTKSYVFWNASLGYRFFIDKTTHQFSLRGTNLGDEEGRNHTSFLKDRVPLPGRNLTLTYLLRF